MNTEEMNGKIINNVYFPDNINNQPQVLCQTEDIKYHMSATYHGDHDEFWIVQSIKVGGKFKEKARWNPKYVEGWEWA